MEKEINFGGKHKIYGTLGMPNLEGTSPAVLLIAGSGPLDRDGNGSKGKFQTNLYKDLAQYITGLGFITLRYDKHGTGRRNQEDWLSAGLSDLTEDAITAVEFLRSHPNVDPEKIILAGHSEGVIIATKVASSMKVGGVLFLSGGVDNLMQALEKQRRIMNEELFTKPFLGPILRKLKVAEKGEKQAAKFIDRCIRSQEDIIKVQLFFRQPAKWYREHAACDTREALQDIDCPILALVGDRDPLADGDVLSELSTLAKGKTEYRIIPQMEHGLRVQYEERSILKSGKRFKEIAKRPLHPEALKDIKAWLHDNFQALEHEIAG
ncbi:alpha/beta hydrolase [Peribacillus sp. SCS-155]|uniref:alpha/beta hydrolase n=1 Tax=Peribacillus sedimenti TaxID=3115297 RepID=UPI003906C20E